MKKIKVSIIIPIYNAQEYLEECLRSVVGQTYSNLEIILVDDGSKDDSPRICDDYAKSDKRILVLHQKNSGVSIARNEGLKKATGEYVSFIDADDLVHPDYIRRLVNNIKDNSLSTCQIKNFYTNNIVFDKTSEENLELEKDHFIELCCMNLLNTPCCKLYNLDLLRKNNILFDTKLSLGEDLLFNFDYLEHVDKLVITKEALYYYRRSGNNTLSTAYNPKMFDIQLLLFDRYTNFFKDIVIDNESLYVFDLYRYSTLRIIIENEFKNKKISFWQRYINARKVSSDERFIKRIKDIRYSKKTFMCFLIRHRLILTYKVVNKTKSIMQ